MNALHIILPVAVGALIGYCTNYIAIKMLFRPRKALYLGGRRLPFTPGVIPKNQPRIAAAVGQAVSGSLLTEEDLAAGLSGEGLKTALTDRLEAFLREERTPLGGMLVHADLDRDGLTDRVGEAVGEKILEGVKKMDMEAVVGEIARTSFADLLSNPMIAMFLGGGMLDSIVQKLGMAVADYAETRGPELVNPMVKEELESILDKPLGENLADLDIPPETLRTLLETIVDKLLADSLQPLLGSLDVKAMVEEKVNAMDARELEDLVLSVMKNELQAIINLGALIGAVIGIVNIFI